MTLAEVKRILECEMIHGDNLDHKEVRMACGCDLMSDVLRFIKPNCLLLTGLAHPQVVRTAEMADINAICFVRGKKPDEETILLAKQNGVWLLATHLPMFESCGRLYREGLPSCFESPR
jgi:predicted transcriptional regulator